jgi:hypothetical protein
VYKKDSNNHLRNTLLRRTTEVVTTENKRSPVEMN